LAESEFLAKFGKVTIFGPSTILTLPYDRYGIYEWERSKPEENLGTLAKIRHSKMANDCRQTRKNWILPGEFQIGKFHHGKIPLDNYEAYAMQTAYLHMHGSACSFRQLSPLHKFFVWGLINFQFGPMTRTDPKGTHKILGKSPKGT